MPIEGELRDRLSALAAEGAPQVATLAGWVLDHPQEVAFKSVRALAQSADVNSNTVVRLAQALGFEGYEACRAAFQSALVERTVAYSARAEALSAGDGPSMLGALRDAHERNAAAMFSPEMSALTDECADRLVAARRAICVGVRSCQPVAQYFSYVGAMAFANITPYPAQPGGFLDLLSDATADDVVIAVTFRHYSVEVVDACRLAQERGAAVIAMTDSLSSPIARGAWRVLPLEMAGPQFLPSLASAFLLVEILLARMTMKAQDAAARIEAFESRVMRAGGYVGGR